MQRERPSEVALLLRLVRPIVVLVGVGSIVALALGIWLAEYVGYGIGGGWGGAAGVLMGGEAAGLQKPFGTHDFSPPTRERFFSGRSPASAGDPTAAPRDPVGG